MKFLLCLMVFLSGCVSASKTDVKKAQLHLQIGASLLGNHKNPEALGELLLAEKLDPKNKQIQMYLGLAYSVREHFATAEEHFKRALQLDKKFTEARFYYGKMLIDQSRFDDAITQLKIAADDLTFSKPDQILTTLAVGYFKKKDFQLAKKTLNQSLNFRSNDCGATNLMGRTHYELQNFERAAKTLDQATQLCRDNNFDEPLFFSGLSYFKKGDRNNAVDRLTLFLAKYENSEYAPQARMIMEMLK